MRDSNEYGFNRSNGNHVVESFREIKETAKQASVRLRKLSSDTYSGYKNGKIQSSSDGEKHFNLHAKRTFLFIFLLFLCSVVLLMYVYARFPKLEEHEKQYLKLPSNIEEAKILGNILNRYNDKYWGEVLVAVFFTYIFLQTFAIPGSIFLSILSGFLFSFWMALFLICFCSATGATFCYGISYLVGRRLILKYFPQKVHDWSLTVQKHRDSLLNYIIFLRVTPFLPNWFINVAAPVIDVPVFPFWIGTFLGVAPPSFVAIQTGTTLNQMTSSSEAFSWNSLFILLGVGVISLLPVLFKKKLKNSFGG